MATESHQSETAHRIIGLSSTRRGVSTQDPVLFYLNKIVRSRLLSGSTALTNLLTYLVNKVLRSEQHNIKEHLLGREVFARGSSFSPQEDPIVRVQLRRLRQKMHQYYKREGFRDSIYIEVPRGSYVPVIIHHHVEHPGQELQQPRCRLAVLPFLPTGNDDSDHPFSRSITKILIDDLARSSNLDVVAHISTSIFHGRHKDHHRIVKYLNVDAILEGDVLLSDTQLNITIRLMNARTGAALWTTNLDVGAHDLLKSAEEVSRSVIPIVGSLLKPTLNAS